MWNRSCSFRNIRCLTCCRTLSRGSAWTMSPTVSPVSSLLWSVSSNVSGLTRQRWIFPTCEGRSGFQGGRIHLEGGKHDGKLQPQHSRKTLKVKEDTNKIYNWQCSCKALNCQWRLHGEDDMPNQKVCVSQLAEAPLGCLISSPVRGR